MANVGIMGAGSWGTALALLLHKNGHQVTVGPSVKKKWRCFPQKESM